MLNHFSLMFPLKLLVLSLNNGCKLIKNQIRLHPNTLHRDRGNDIPKSWMSTVRLHTQQTKASTVSARPTIEQPTNRPPITEQHQGDQTGTFSLLARPITEFHSRLNQPLHCDLHDQSQSSPPNSTQQIDQSQIINQQSD